MLFKGFYLPGKQRIPAYLLQPKPASDKLS